VQQAWRCIKPGDSGHSRDVRRIGVHHAERRGPVTGLTGVAA